ncbi:DUF2799 domain-containing protein [Pseudoalteromonas sp. HF66]|uniref:DUF2799 domain-containing protein n=1 Tax=Pseudoalteromonas sp. HF66 TaxID=2721559 RepID=UPI0014321CC0|nr:DUF2799 domain-containing protein [Pseudoalteromonas sp. HF66]NIZ05374.1 DUF2799 domain-containing protein [Pseudoalteromonas sp. HF66]
MRKWTLPLLSLIVLAGCTSVSKDECLQANWQGIGYKHGADGTEYHDGLDALSQCGEYGVSADIDEYKEGYDLGLAVYCEPENGFTLGIQGVSYNGVCNSTAFRKAWQEGNDRYQVQQRLAYIDDRIDDIDRRLKDIRAELNSNQLDNGQQKELYRERKDLEHERKDLRKERALLPLLNKLPSVEISSQW